MVTTFYPPYGFGGDATYVRALSRALAARGHDVHVIHCADAFRLLNGGEPNGMEIVDAGVTVHRLESHLGALSPIITQQTSQPGLKRGALKQLLSQDFDVVHFHNISLVGGLGVLGLSRAPCTLYTLHEHWLLCATHVFWKNKSRACEKPECLSCCLRSGTPPQVWRYTGARDSALRKVDRLISPSEYTAKRHRPIVDAPILTLPHFVDAGAWRAPTSPLPTPEPYFLYVGRMTESKGVRALVSAFAKSSKHHLVLVGDGPLRAPLQHEYRARSNLYFLGALPQDALAGLYQGARALILPSLAPETFGLTVIEAAAFGTPALVRQGSGGAEEIVEQNELGLIYADEHDLLRLIVQLSTDADFAGRLGRNAKAAYTSRYTLDAHLSAYFQCIEEVLASKREAQ